MNEQFEKLLTAVKAKAFDQFHVILIEAYENGHFPAIMNMQDQEGLTLLHHAIKEDSAEIALYLLTNDDIDLIIGEHSSGLMPVHFAVIYNRPTILEKILEIVNSGINELDEEGLSALHHAVCAINISLPVLKLLLAHSDILVNCKISEEFISDNFSESIPAGATPLHIAVIRQHAGAVSELLEHQDIDIFATISGEDDNEEEQSSNSSSENEDSAEDLELPARNATAIHYAAALGNEEIIISIIDYLKRCKRNDSDQSENDDEENDTSKDKVLDIPDSRKKLAIYYAVTNGHSECVALLLNYDIFQMYDGALDKELEITLLVENHSRKKNLLFVAASRSDWLTVAAILNAILIHLSKLNHNHVAYLINQKDNELNALIHLAYQADAFEVMESLIKFGALLEINEVDNEGYPVGYRAIRDRDKTALAILKKHPHFDINAPVENSRQQKLRQGAREFLLEEAFYDGSDEWVNEYGLGEAEDALVDCAEDDSGAVDEDEHEGDPPLVALVKDFYNDSYASISDLMELLQDKDIDLERGDSTTSKALKVAKKCVGQDQIRKLEDLRADLNHAIRDIRSQGKMKLCQTLSQCSYDDLFALLELCDETIENVPLVGGLVNFKLNKPNKKQRPTINLEFFKKQIHKIIKRRIDHIQLCDVKGDEEPYGLPRLRKLFATTKHDVLEKFLTDANSSNAKFVVFKKYQNNRPVSELEKTRAIMTGIGFIKKPTKLVGYCLRTKAVAVAKEILASISRKSYYFSEVLADQKVSCYVMLKAAYPERGLESSSGDSEEDSDNLLRKDLELQLEKFVMEKERIAPQQSNVAVSPHRNFIPIFRGINFLRDKFLTKEDRMTYLQKLPKKKAHYAESCFTLLGKNCKDDVPPDQLDVPAEKISQMMASLNIRERTPIKKTWEPSVPWMFNTLRYFLQNYYTVNKNAFDKNVLLALPPHIRAMAEKYANGITQIFNSNPLVSGSSLPRHSVRYAIGDSRASSKIDRILNPRYQSHTGRPKRPIAGVVFVALYPEEEYRNVDVINVLKAHANLEMNISKELLNESEITFPAKLDHICIKLPIIYPSFEGSFKPVTKNNKAIDIDLFGFTKVEFDGFKKQIKESHRGSPERQEVEIKIRERLTQFYTQILWKMAQHYVEAKGGQLAVELPSGELWTKNVESLTPFKLANLADKIAKDKQRLQSAGDASKKSSSLEEIDDVAEDQQAHKDYSETEDADCVSNLEREEEQELRLSNQEKIEASESEDSHKDEMSRQLSTFEVGDTGTKKNGSLQEMAKGPPSLVKLNNSPNPTGTIANSKHLLLFKSVQAPKRVQSAIPEDAKKAKRPLLRDKGSAAAPIDIPGLTYQAIPGDGHCLYNAVAIYLNRTQELLREDVAFHIENNLHEFSDFLERRIGQSVANYVQGIRGGREWAANVEIEVLMRVYNRPIIVIKSDKTIQNPEVLDGRFSGEAIFVFYNGTSHYDMLLRNEEIAANIIISYLMQLNESPLLLRR